MSKSTMAELRLFTAVGKLAATEQATEQALSTLLECLADEEIFYESTKRAIEAAREVVSDD